MVLAWLGLRALFRDAGVGGALLALGAREPRSDDLEERQLVNVAEEMAIAAGVPAPRVRLLDSDAPNAAVLGSHRDNAVLVVTTGLLGRLGRDETQGVVGSLVASVGQGDLRLALSMTTAFQSVELVFLVFDALFNLSRTAWRELASTTRWMLGDRSDPRAAQAVAALLDRRLGEVAGGGLVELGEDATRDHPRTATGRAIKRFPFLWALVSPFMLLYVVFLFLRFQIFFFRLLVVGPMLVGAWRLRRYQADAAAVQLTRNPDGLARALRRLLWSGELGGMASHPPIDKRLRRLVAMGAAAPEMVGAPPRTRRWRGAGSPLGWAAGVVLVPLVLLAAYLLLVVAAMILGLALLFSVGFTVLAMTVLHALLF